MHARPPGRAAAALLAVSLLSVPCSAREAIVSGGATPRTKNRLLVAYVAGNDPVSRRRRPDVYALWKGMQYEYPGWSIRCMMVTGGYLKADFQYSSDKVCSSLMLNAPDSYVALGHKIKAMMQWIASRVLRFDFLLKADLDTFICFSMVTDMIDVMIKRVGTVHRIYLGHLETCSRVVHHPQDKFYDEHYLDDLLHRQDVDCYPPYMQGLGYVLSRDLVQLIGFMGPTLKVYTNEDMMVGIWLVGHQVHRGQLNAKIFSESWYQTTLSECFPLYYNHKVPSFVMRECAHFHNSTGMCWQPRAAALPSAGAISLATRGGTIPAPKLLESATRLNELMTSANTAPADEIQLDGEALRRLRQLVTVGIKAVTHLRNHVHFMLHSIHRRYPGMRVIIADDEYLGTGGEEWRRLSSIITDLNVTYIKLVPRIGLSAGRNALATACQTRYMVLLDDDVFFTAATRLNVMLNFLESRPTVQIVAGSYAQYDSRSATTNVDDYSLIFERSSSEPREWRAYRPPDPERWGSCRRVHAAHNFFMARTETLRTYPWHPKLAIFEHEHFFLQLFLANQVVYVCPHVSVFHHRAANMHDAKYITNSIRFKEHLFARYFCDAFVNDVAHFKAPYWSYDCINFQLCPQWVNTSTCTPMIDPRVFTRDGIRVLEPAPAASKAVASSKSKKDEQSDQTSKPILFLGETGSGVGLLAQLFKTAASTYMLWREPNDWRYTSHIPDELFGEMLAELYRCELSSQQLALLHTQAPDYVGEQPLNGEVDAGQLPALKTITEDDEEEEPVSIEEVAQRYSEKAMNSSKPRFCGPRMSTAVCLTRLEHGLPLALKAVPVNIVLLTRNPLDIVVARVTAKRQRRMPVWPECTMRTVGTCAEQLCGSMERMLDSLDSISSDERVIMLQWEQFVRRRTKTIREIFSELNGPVNTTALKLAIQLADKNIRAFNARGEKYPLSTHVTQLIRQRCGRVMLRMGYNTSLETDAAEETTALADRRAPKGRRSLPEGPANSTDDSRSRLVMLRHAYKPAFYFCPIPNTGAEVLFKFFIRRDVPEATIAPSCWPTRGSDECPMQPRKGRSASRWHRRWGAYPFETVDVTKKARKAKLKGGSLPGHSFAVVRNPWERLVTIYQNYVDFPEKRAAAIRSWIREFHEMGDKELLTFSHFVRWLVQRPPLSMEPYFRPFSEVCHFGTLKYTHVARLENLEEDLRAILRTLRFTDPDDERLLGTLIAKYRSVSGREPGSGSPDRILRVMHYYLSDDQYDLVEMVRQRYREDIERFQYEFPANHSYAPWARYHPGQDRGLIASVPA